MGPAPNTRIVINKLRFQSIAATPALKLPASVSTVRLNLLSQDNNLKF